MFTKRISKKERHSLCVVSYLEGLNRKEVRYYHVALIWLTFTVHVIPVSRIQTF